MVIFKNAGFTMDSLLETTTYNTYYRIIEHIFAEGLEGL